MEGQDGTGRPHPAWKVTPARGADWGAFLNTRWPNLRPDGSRHKFDVAYKDQPRMGYLGLQDHGSPCWFKNVKIKPLK